jgi:hypothetical protein
MKANLNKKLKTPSTTSRCPSPAYNCESSPEIPDLIRDGVTMTRKVTTQCYKQMKCHESICELEQEDNLAYAPMGHHFTGEPTCLASKRGT